MRRCPVCNQTYANESVNFCLNDGATLMLDEPQSYSSQPSLNREQSIPPFGNTIPQNFAPPQTKKSRAWIFGIIAVVVLIGGGALIGLLVLLGIASQQVASDKQKPETGIPANEPSRQTQIKLTDDFSKWADVKTSTFGRAAHEAGEYQLSATQSGWYYIQLSRSTVDPQYVTNKRTTRVTVRSVSGASPSLGFGLVVHSDTKPLTSDYAFLIRNDKDPSFRVVQHTKNGAAADEKNLVNWTRASQIRTGTQTNQIEVRSDGKQLQFYINGQFATSITDELNTNDGIVGIYSSDTAPVAFSDLQISE